MPVQAGREAVNRKDWLLLFMSAEALGVDGPPDLDPVRVQKGMFLLSRRGPARHLYTFRPYNWGPFSRDIYDDLDSLQADGLLQSQRRTGRSWRVYWTTDAGHDRAAAIAARLPKTDLDWLGKMRHYVTSRSFTRLLRELYEAYPEYKHRSLLDK